MEFAAILDMAILAGKMAKGLKDFIDAMNESERDIQRVQKELSSCADLLQFFYQAIKGKTSGANMAEV